METNKKNVIKPYAICAPSYTNLKRPMYLQRVNRTGISRTRIVTQARRFATAADAQQVLDEIAPKLIGARWFSIVKIENEVK